MASDPHLATRQLQPAGSPGDDRPRVRPDGREGQSRCGCSPLKCSPDGSRSFAEPRWAEVRQAHAHGYILAGAESREPLTSSSPFRATWEKPFFSLRLFPLSAKSRANFLSCRTTRDPFYTHGLPSSYLTQRERGRQELSGQAAGWPVLALSSVSPTPAAQLGAQTCSSLSGKNLGLQPRSDLIKAATAHRVATRSRGQPEKVVTFLVPRLTYRPV